MLRKLTASLTVLGCLAVLATPADAAITFDDDVTPNVIFSSGGVSNGSFTVDRANGVELGLRGKLRFDTNNQPQNIFNSNGDGSYTFQAGAAPSGYSWDSNSPTTPVWSFEWSVNTNYQGTSNFNLSDLTYKISLDANPDADPGPSTDFLTFDPINGGNPTSVLWDHAIGTNSTANGGGSEATTVAEYANLIANNNVAQNSWNYEFFNDTGSPLATFDPSVRGVYTITLAAFNDNDVQVASTSIDINVVPEPASLLVWSLLGTVGIVAGWRRRRRTA